MPNYGQYPNLSYKDRFIKRQSDRLTRNFEKSDGVSKVTLTYPDGTVNEDFLIHIYNPNISGKGQKQYSALPYCEVRQGSVIDYDDGYKYLAITKDTHFTTNDFGKIVKLNVMFKWLDVNGQVQTQYGAMTDGIGFQDEDSTVPLTQSKREVWLQLNPLTVNFYKNQRFIFGNKEAFKITDYDNFSKEGILVIKVENVQLVAEDDLVNGVAYNSIQQSTPTPINGVNFSELSLGIPRGLEKSVQVYKYINSVQQSTHFTFRIDGIDPTKYSIVSTSTNSITIKCLDYFYSGLLVAIEEVTLSETTIPLTLKSVI